MLGNVDLTRNTDARRILGSHCAFDGPELDIASYDQGAIAGFLRIFVGSLVGG